MDDDPEMDERCLALLHAARIGDTAAVSRITYNILFLYQYAGMRPSWKGMNNLMAVLLRAQGKAARHEGNLGMDTLVGIEESAHYDPSTYKVTNLEKAEDAYHRWRNERRTT